MKLFVEVLSEPTVAADGLPAYREHDNGPLLGINVMVPEKTFGSQFDVAQVRLQGAIRTRVGARSSVKKVLNLVEYCSWSQFTPVSSPSITTQMYTTKVGFDFSGKSAARNVLLPSTTFSGSTYITRHTAINDRALVQGSCDTYCWVNVDLFRDGVCVQGHQQAVNLDCGPSRLSFTSSKQLEHAASATCRPATSMRSAISGNSVSPVEVSIAEPDQPMSLNRLVSGEKIVAVDLPIQASFGQLPLSTVETINADGGIRCEVEARWLTKQAFSVSSSTSNADRAQIVTQLSSTQTSEIHFPPTLSPLPETHKNNAASAVGMLHLILPGSASMPSMATDLLDVSYELELKYTFHLGPKKQAIRFNGKAKMECSLSP